ncbi:Proline-, glutamic acid- and leucine-rich protein 1 [Holothuria leucospilota]|uniref:Proline-, glutamic acid- and leucine-rich protein 1 n=1 Tax=Holothuria leucospilota TaxID=206669 RepID=A0A9Q1BPC1_HOLLE|nr:Proline-, glutamic acid- and leucine-rich protein 1 [Holothuria leucospilota]
MSGSIHASYLLMVLPSVYEAALKLLTVLIKRCGSHLLPHGGIINQLVLQTLNWTTSMEADHNRSVLKFRNLRCQVYEVYLDWLNTVGLGAFMGGKSDRLMEHLSTDAYLQENVNLDSESTKSVSSESTGSRRKKQKKQHQWNVTSEKENSRYSGIGEQTEKLCLLAVKVLRRLFFTCGTRLKWTLHRNYHTAATRVLLQYQNGLSPAPSPYHYSANCRKELYHALLASLLVPSPHWSAPLQSSICIFSQGRLDSYAVVKEFCSEAAIICENIIHPRTPHISTPTITDQVSVKANDNLEFSSFKLSKNLCIDRNVLQNDQPSMGCNENNSAEACETEVVNDLQQKELQTIDVDDTSVDKQPSVAGAIVEEPGNRDEEVNFGKDTEIDLQDSEVMEIEESHDNDDGQEEKEETGSSKLDTKNGKAEERRDYDDEENPVTQEKIDEESKRVKEEGSTPHASEIDNEGQTKKRKAEFSDEDEENKSKEPTIDDMLATFSAEAPDEDQ